MSGSGGGLAHTGPDTDLPTAAGSAILLVVAGLSLLLLGRRRRSH